MDKFLSIFMAVFSVLGASSLYAEGATRHINRFPATENQFPYMVSLQQLSQVHTTAHRGHKCGGALVTLQHAVTSAYCILERISEPPSFQVINPAEYRIFAGSAFLSNDSSSDRIRRIANITIHPDYNTSFGLNHRFINDIAVITFGTPFEGNTVAGLLITNIDGEIERKCILTGWGRGTRLHYVQMWAINDVTCREFSSAKPVPSQMCGLVPHDKGALGASRGDEGGPLVCGGKLLGILVHHPTSNLDVYTRAAHYNTWIENVVAQPIHELGREP